VLVHNSFSDTRDGVGERVNARPELTEWCIAFVAEMLERPPSAIDPDMRFSRMGFDSAMAVQLVVALEERLGRELSPDLIADHPTISRLATHVAALGR
jgi:acyl carrier protein